MAECQGEESLAERRQAGPALPGQPFIQNILSSYLVCCVKCGMLFNILWVSYKCYSVLLRCSDSRHESPWVGSDIRVSIEADERDPRERPCRKTLPYLQSIHGI